MTSRMIRATTSRESRKPFAEATIYRIGVCPRAVSSTSITTGLAERVIIQANDEAAYYSGADGNYEWR